MKERLEAAEKVVDHYGELERDADAMGDDEYIQFCKGNTRAREYRQKWGQEGE